MRLTEKDILAIKIASKADAVSYGMLTDEIGIDRRRIAKLVKEGYFKKHNTPTKGGKHGRTVVNRYSYSLDTKGLEYARDNGYAKAFGGFNGYDHLLKMEKHVKGLVEDGIELSDMKNSKELEIIYSKEIGKAKRSKDFKFAVCDLAVMSSDNGVIIYEIETENYRGSLKAQHKNFATKIAGVSSSNYITI